MPKLILNKNIKLRNDETGYEMIKLMQKDIDVAHGIEQFERLHEKKSNVRYGRKLKFFTSLTCFHCFNHVFTKLYFVKDIHTVHSETTKLPNWVRNDENENIFNCKLQFHGHDSYFRKKGFQMLLRPYITSTACTR